jgi:hypothetical protein
MRGLASYLVAGILAVLALDFIAPPVGLGFALGAWPSVENVSIVQSVNRTSKTDRLVVPTSTVEKQQSPHRPPVVMVGCDPVFSPLSASAQANFAGRCVA